MFPLPRAGELNDIDRFRTSGFRLNGFGSISKTEDNRSHSATAGNQERSPTHAAILLLNHDASRSLSPEGEGKCLRSRLLKLDHEGVVCNRPLLSHQLI